MLERRDPMWCWFSLSANHGDWVWAGAGTCVLSLLGALKTISDCHLFALVVMYRHLNILTGESCPAPHNGVLPRPPECGRSDQTASERVARESARSIRCRVLSSPRPGCAFGRRHDPRFLRRPLAPPHRSVPPRPEAAPPKVCAPDCLARPRTRARLPQRRSADSGVDRTDRGVFREPPVSWAESSAMTFVRFHRSNIALQSNR